MSELRMGTAEAKFADMIWDNEPVSSGDLAKLANKEFEWKKTTSFTVLKRLCERGLFQNQNGIVTSLIAKEEFYARHSASYVEETFGGSLPAFLTAFGSRKKLTDKEIDEIRQIIDSMRG
ncbi:MAG: BlaI/MecI/CopY family transcriptional regulator [Lachnospiraceae bacterium]|nr:BlaI/MecI/CopY family transcriptional regulator [Lachnospiraceae bacterium]